MKNAWLLLYVTLFVVSMPGGAGVFGRADVSRTPIEGYFVAASFVVALMFPVLALWHASIRGLTPVPEPSFSRGTRGGWRSDPLQWSRICTLLLSAWFLGALINALRAPGQSEMALYWKASLALGFLLGEVLARKAFSKDIQS